MRWIANDGLPQHSNAAGAYIISLLNLKSLISHFFLMDEHFSVEVLFPFSETLYFMFSSV